MHNAAARSSADVPVHKNALAFDPASAPFLTAPDPLFHRDHFVVLILNCLFQDIIADLCTQCEYCGSCLVAHRRLRHLLKRLEAFLYPRLAVPAHHALDLHCLCHIPFSFLHCMMIYRAGTVFPARQMTSPVTPCTVDVDQVQPQRIRHHAEA